MNNHGVFTTAKQKRCSTTQTSRNCLIRDHSFRNGDSNHSFKFSGPTIGILLANAFMSNEVRTPQQEALLCLRRNRGTSLTNDMSGCASSVRIQKGGKAEFRNRVSHDGRIRGGEEGGGGISSLWGREKPVHFHILYCQFNFLQVDRSVKDGAYPWLHQLCQNSPVG